MSQTHVEPWHRVLHGQGGTVGDLQILAIPGVKIGVLALTPLGLFFSGNEGISWSRFQGDKHPPLTQSLAVAYDVRTAEPSLLLGSAIGLFRTTAEEHAAWTPLFTGLSVEAVGMPRQLDSGSLLLAATVEKGLLLSEDSGVSWDDANAGLNYDPIVAICFSPLYADDKTIFLATDSDIFRSRNGGKAWRSLELDALPQSIQCMSACIDSHGSPVLFVGSAVNGLWSSRDRGKSWEEQIPDRGIRSISVVHADGDNQILVVTDEGIYVSPDAGMTWRQNAVAIPDACCAVMIQPLSGALIIAGRMEHGICRKPSGSDEWIMANTGLEASSRTQLGVASCEEGVKYTLVVNDASNRLLLSRDEGTSWVPSKQLPAINSQHPFSMLQCTPQRFSIFAIAEQSAFEYSNASNSWTTVLPLTLGKHPLAIVGLAFRAYQEHPRLLAIMEDGEVMYCLPTANWESAGIHFGDDQIVAAKLIPSQINTASSWAVTYSVNDQDELGYPSLWHTGDGGLTWDLWMQGSVPEALAVCVTANAAGQDVVFVGMQNTMYRIDTGSDCQPSVEGVSPTRVDNGSLAITAITASPDFSNDATLFVATNQKIYVSRDGGATLERWNVDGPSQILDIQPSPDFSTDRLVYALELGGSVWRRTDISRHLP